MTICRAMFMTICRAKFMTICGAVFVTIGRAMFMTIENFFICLFFTFCFQYNNICDNEEQCFWQ